jgi:hypothetical protein
MQQFWRSPAFLLNQFLASHMFLPMNPASRRQTGWLSSTLSSGGNDLRFDPMIPGTNITGSFPSGGNMHCTASVMLLGVRVQVCMGLPRAL